MYSLKIWNHPTTGEVRIYMAGTSRDSIYLKLSKDGRVVWSSKAADTPHKFQTGQHYPKVRKDGQAAEEVCEAFGIALGDGSTAEDFERAYGLARDGIQVEG